MRKINYPLVTAGLIIFAAAALIIGGCSEKIVSPEPQQVGVSMQVKLSTPALFQAIDHFDVTVVARDIAGIITAPLAYSAGIIEGDVIVPAGRDRIFVVRAMDKDGNELYIGETVADIDPNQQSVILNINLYPVASLLYFKPHYQEHFMNDYFAAEVYINQVPGISSISLAFAQNDFPGGIDSVTLGTTLDPIKTLFEAWAGDFMYYADITYYDALPGSLTDAAGNAHLATIYFHSYADWQFDTATVVVTPQIMGLWDIGGMTIPSGQVYTDNTEIFLTNPAVAK
jgi:hypothetical protein